MLLQAPIPGGVELLIIMLVLLLLFGPVVAVVVYLLQRTQGGDAEVAELEARVDELEAQIEAGDEADESGLSSANQNSSISGDAASNDVSVEDQRGDEE